MKFQGAVRGYLRMSEDPLLWYEYDHLPHPYLVINKILHRA